QNVQANVRENGGFAIVVFSSQADRYRDRSHVNSLADSSLCSFSSAAMLSSSISQIGEHNLYARLRHREIRAARDAVGFFDGGGHRTCARFSQRVPWRCHRPFEHRASKNRRSHKRPGRRT
ncbi:hypothetical protein X777_08859, partial [Ooceraea biroi]